MCKESIKSALIPILKRNGVIRAALFGSVVRGDDNDQSDIDILVEFEKGKSLLDLVGLKIELEEALNRKVDVITYESLHPLLKDSILSGREALYGEAA